MKINWKEKLKTVLEKESFSKDSGKTALTKADKSFVEKTDEIVLSAFVSDNLATPSENLVKNVPLSAFVSDNLRESSEKNLKTEKPQLSLDLPLTKADNALPTSEKRLHAFQTAWTGICFSCEKPVQNYTDNCPSCGDHSSWF